MWHAHLAGIDFDGASRPAPSCARVIYDFYGGSWRFHKFNHSGLMAAVDQSDTADFTVEEVMNPKGWVLLAFIMDPRTGLGRYKDFAIGKLELMRRMVGFCRTMPPRLFWLNPMSANGWTAIPETSNPIKSCWKRSAAPTTT